MKTIAIEETAYDAIEANEEEALRWVNSALALGSGSLHDDGAGDSWLVYSAYNMSLDEVAWWGCLMDNMRRVGRLWQPPKHSDSDEVDVEAASAEVQAMIADRVVPPSEIAYTEIVDVEYPVMVREERTYVDPDTGVEYTYFVWVDTCETYVVQEEWPLPNPCQLTLDAQGVSPSVMAGFDQVPGDWSPQVTGGSF